MVRVKRGLISLKRRRNVLRQVKGFRWGRKAKERAAGEALLHAYTHSFHDRKKKKGRARRLWNIKINAAVRSAPSQLTYNKFVFALKQKNIKLDRKILATLAEHHPQVFAQVLAHATN